MCLWVGGEGAILFCHLRHKYRIAIGFFLLLLVFSITGIDINFLPFQKLNFTKTWSLIDSLVLPNYLNSVVPAKNCQEIHQIHYDSKWNLGDMIVSDSVRFPKSRYILQHYKRLGLKKRFELILLFYVTFYTRAKYPFFKRKRLKWSNWIESFPTNLQKLALVFVLRLLSLSDWKCQYKAPGKSGVSSARSLFVLFNFLKKTVT